MRLLVLRLLLKQIHLKDRGFLFKLLALFIELQHCLHLKLVIEFSGLSIFIHNCDPGVDLSLASDPVDFEGLHEVLGVLNIQAPDVELNLIFLRHESCSRYHRHLTA